MQVVPNGDELRCVQVNPNTSIAISSMVGIMRDLIQSNFPKDYFKHVNIDTSSARASMNVGEKHNKEAYKIPLPSIAYTVGISIDNTVNGLIRHPHMMNPNLWTRRHESGHYNTLISDFPTPERKYKRFSMYYTSNYVTSNINVKLRVETFQQNTNVLHYLNTQLALGTFRNLPNQYIYTEIPKSFISILAKMFGKDLSNPTDMYDFEMIMSKYSNDQRIVVRREDPSTGKDGFFVGIKVDFLILFDDLSASPEALRDGMVESGYTIEFRAQVSHWVPNAFVMNVKQHEFKSVYEDREYLEKVFEDTPEEDNGLISLSIGSKTLNQEKISWNHKNETYIGSRYGRKTYAYDINRKSIDLDLFDVTNEEFKRVHSYLMMKGFDPQTLCKVIISSNGNIEIPEIDYTTLKIKLDNLKGSDIAVDLYVNRPLYESLVVSMGIDKYFYNNRVISTIVIANKDFEARVPVYKDAIEFDRFGEQISFVQPDYESGDNIRILTPYGEGFVGVYENRLTKPGYEVIENKPYIMCVTGEDSSGNKILRELETRD